MMIGTYPCCDGTLMIGMPERTPVYFPENCPHCGAAVWHRLSRFDPESWTEAAFLAEHTADDATKQITRKPDIEELARTRQSPFPGQPEMRFVSTPTGRVPSEPEIQHLNTALKPVGLHDNFIQAMDFAELERLVLNAMLFAYIDFPPCEDMARTTEIETSVTSMLAAHEKRGKTARARPRPAYLKHDPTKRQRRPR